MATLSVSTMFDAAQASRIPEKTKDKMVITHQLKPTKSTQITVIGLCLYFMLEEERKGIPLQLSTKLDIGYFLSPPPLMTLNIYSDKRT